MSQDEPVGCPPHEAPTPPNHPTVRLRLRPGLRAVPREPGLLQVGLDPPRRALLPDCPDVRRLLAALGTGTPVGLTSPEVATAVARLERAGLVVPVIPPAVCAALSPTASPAGPRAAGPARVQAAALARHGEEAGTRSVDRASCRALLEVSPGLRAELVRLGRVAGLGEPAARAEATVALLVVEGEYSRSRVDGWVRDGLPHLCVQAHDGVVTIGPYVVPGVTACRRCVDVHQGEDDPRRPVIIEQLARRPVAEPVDDLLLTLALSWAVQDLATAAEGVRPSSWSTTISLRPDLSTVRRTWTRHPCCGCSWDQVPGWAG